MPGRWPSKALTQGGTTTLIHHRRFAPRFFFVGPHPWPLVTSMAAWCGASDLAREPIQQLAEPRHAPVEVFHPGGGLPNLDAHGGADHHHISPRLHAQELTEPLG